MGDIADGIIGGEFCQVCCCVLEHSLGDYPQTCPECAAEDSVSDGAPYKANMKGVKVRCSVCHKTVKALGLGDHVRDKHPTIAPRPAPTPKAPAK